MATAVVAYETLTGLLNVGDVRRLKLGPLQQLCDNTVRSLVDEDAWHSEVEPEAKSIISRIEAMKPVKVG